MPGIRVSWTPTPTEFPEGTPAATGYRVHAGALVADVPLTANDHTFSTVTPGEYQTFVDTMAGVTVLATQQGNSVRVPTPVSVPIAMGVTGELVP